jgi:hypothetical protein
LLAAARLVVVRFVLNPEVLDYPGVTPISTGSCGATGFDRGALVGCAAARPDQRLVRATEAAIALLAFALVT